MGSCVTVFAVDTEDKKKLDQLLQLTAENNQYIKKVRKSQRYASLFRLFYWLVLIGISVGTYYYVKPIVGETKSFVDHAKESLMQAGIVFP